MQYLILIAILLFIVYTCFTPVKENLSTIRLVNYYAPWCGYSKKILPTWGELEKKYESHPTVTVKRVNGDDHPDETAKYGVSGFPTVLLFKNRSDTPIVYRGDRSLYDLEAFIKEHSM